MGSRLRIGAARGVLAVLSIIAMGGTAHSQDSSSGGRTIRPCAAAACEDVTALVVALDTAVRTNSACTGHDVRVAASLYWDPYAFDEESGRIEQPSSPAIGKWGECGRLALRVYSPNVSIVDLHRQDRGARVGCLLVFSSPTWLGPNDVRVIVAVLGPEARDRSEWYVFLSRSGATWNVERVEVGRQR